MGKYLQEVSDMTHEVQREEDENKKGEGEGQNDSLGKILQNSSCDIISWLGCGCL
jgi:hypothetical protein